jgi:UrcA family protein
MYRILSAGAAALVTTLLFVPATAQSASITIAASAPVTSVSSLYQVNKTSVSLDGVDLKTASGAATLLERIDTAARKVCGERPGETMNAARAKVFATCRARTVHYAVKELDAPALTQLAAAR